MSHQAETEADRTAMIPFRDRYLQKYVEMRDPQTVFEPVGQRFYDKATHREMVHIAPGQDLGGWVCFRHPDGQWVTLRREPTLEDWKAIDAAELLGYRGSRP